MIYLAPFKVLGKLRTFFAIGSVRWEKNVENKQWKPLQSSNFELKSTIFFNIITRKVLLEDVKQFFWKVKPSVQMSTYFFVDIYVTDGIEMDNDR